ncbi:MAG: hypothetical protein ACOC33_03790 [bacterium]
MEHYYELIQESKTLLEKIKNSNFCCYFSNDIEKLEKIISNSKTEYYNMLGDGK